MKIKDVAMGNIETVFGLVLLYQIDTWKYHETADGTYLPQVPAGMSVNTAFR